MIYLLTLLLKHATKSYTKPLADIKIKEMKYTILSIICILLFGCQNQETNKEENSDFDLVILNVRIIDPETGIDSTLNLGVKNGTIQKLTTAKIKGSKQIDGTGKIACPGFIDLHSHSPFPFGESLQLRDGVTTILDLEAGAHPQFGYGEFLKDGGSIVIEQGNDFFGVRRDVFELHVAIVLPAQNVAVKIL